jgi:hypothetical protein
MYLNKYVDTLAALAKKPFDYPTKLIIKGFIITARQALVRQQYEKTGLFPSNSTASFCQPLELKSSSECCGIDLSCNLPTTVNQIPVPIEVKDEVNFLFIGELTGIKPFNYIKPSEIQYVKHRKFSNKEIYYTWINRRIVIINKPSLEKIKLRYIPADPTELSAILDCDNKPCWDLEEDIFIEGHLEDTITKMVIPKLNTLLNTQISVDAENN